MNMWLLFLGLGLLYVCFGVNTKEKTKEQIKDREAFQLLGGQGAQYPLEYPNLYGDAGAYNMV